MTVINILIVALFLLAFSLFSYLMVLQTKRWRPLKLSRSMDKRKRRYLKQKERKRRQQIRWQLIMGIILVMVLLTVVSLLKIQQQTNEVIQTSYDTLRQQEQLEKEQETLKQEVSQQNELSDYPEEGLVIFKEDWSALWGDETIQDRFKVLLTGTLTSLFSHREVHLAWELDTKELGIELSGKDALTDVTRRHEEQLLTGLLEELSHLRAVERVRLTQITKSDELSTERLYVRNTEGVFKEEQSKGEGLESHTQSTDDSD